MNITDRAWMELSINTSKDHRSSLFRICALLVSETNELICSAFSDENNTSAWADTIIACVKKQGLLYAEKLFLTINTISRDNTFDLTRITNHISITTIFVGLPDPRLSTLLPYDPLLKATNIHRYSDDLQRSIIDCNCNVFSSSPQSIRFSPYFSNNRISKMVARYLRASGYFLSEDEITNHKSVAALSQYICKKYDLDDKTAKNNVTNAISCAFNEKYGSYDYAIDTRMLDSSWKIGFRLAYNCLGNHKLSSDRIINVGVANGSEAIQLFSGYEDITFVDIAEGGLLNLEKHFPHATYIKSDAADLSMIDACQYDLYVSLRTFNSAFFDINAALAEAYRVLKPDSLMILSVANGFFSQLSNRIMPGLIIPDTDFVDLYRGLNTLSAIARIACSIGFKNPKIMPTNSELFFSCSKAQKQIGVV